MRRLFLCFFLLGVCFLWGSEVSISHSDFFERTINFVIFFAILWYLGAEKIKGIFLARKEEIAHQFASFQDEEKVVKKEREDAEVLLNDAKAKALEIIANAKKESFLIEQQFNMRLDSDIKAVTSNFDNLLLYEKRKILQTEIQMVLQETSKGIKIDGDSYLKILAKGVKNG